MPLYTHVAASRFHDGIVNRGDSFRRRRSRSGSLAPSSPAQSAPEPQERRPVACHRVAMVGAPGVGKTALINQFQTSECINAYDRPAGARWKRKQFFIFLYFIYHRVRLAALSNRFSFIFIKQITLIERPESSISNHIYFSQSRPVSRDSPVFSLDNTGRVKFIFLSIYGYY
ncbi:hypothetical protein ABMA28_004381 [Loxostege sticticalis]|uniref:G domain-containing protein n=1 Tax=Loxostege sticticalis TaxID=481309 RepID=A0ABD0SQY9_LOXSC